MVDTGLQVGEWNELIGEDIQYKIVEPGEGPIAELNQLVRCTYIGRLQDSGKIFEKADDTGYRIGDSDTTPGLELGLRHMRKGEKGLIRCKAKYGFGPIGRKNIGPGAEVAVPPDANLEYEVTVFDILPAFHPKDAPTIARIAEAGLKKQTGNQFFHHEDYHRAIRCYQAAVKALDAESVDEEEEPPEVYKDMCKTFCDISNNLAAALMKLERWKDAKEVCVKVIEIDKDNVKALYRGGLAALRQDNFVEAEMALKEAAKLAPQDPKIRSTIQELKTRRANYIGKEKKMYEKMSGFLTSKAATGIDDDGGKEEEGQEEDEEGEGGRMVDDEEADDDNEGPEEESDMEEEEEERERTVTRTSSSDIVAGDEDEDIEEEEEEYELEDEIEDDDPQQQQMGTQKQQHEDEESVAKSWLRWYIRNYNHVMTATFMILPVIYMWPDIVKGWRIRLGYDDPPSS